MSNKESTEKDNDQSLNNSQNKGQYEEKIDKPIKYIIHQQNIVKSNNFQINNNYLLNSPESQNLLNSINNNNIKDEKIDNRNNLTNSRPLPLTERYRKEKIFIYQKKKNNNNNNSKNYNNNFIYFIKPNKIRNDYNNNIFRNGNTQRISKNNVPRKVKYNNNKNGLSNKSNNSNKDLNNSNENNNEENSSIFSGNTENYKILNVKKITHSRFDSFDLDTPNNIKLHTIVCTSKKKDKDKDKVKIIPQNLFKNKEKGIKSFDKNRLKYIKAAVFIQKSYRNYKNGDKANLKSGKKYSNYYCSIYLIQSLITNKYWKLFKKRFKVGENNNNESSKITSKLRNKSYKTLSNINIEKLIKEKEDLEKKLNDVIKENSILKKKMNSSNKDLISRNLALSEKLDKSEQKTKQLEKENEKYLSEFSKTKDKYAKIESEVIDINKKLKTTHFKFIIEKKEMKQKQILNKYFKRFKEMAQQPYRLRSKRSKKSNIINENENENNNDFDNDNDDDNNYNLVKLLSSAVKTNTDEYITKRNEEEAKKQKELMKEINEKNELLKKRTKLLIDLIYKKDKAKTKLLHSCFSKFYYKGMIKSGKLENDLIRQNEKIKEEKKRKEEEEIRRKKEEDEKKRIIEEEKRREEEEERRKFEEEERKKREEEERKKEEERKREEDAKLKEQMRKMNKINMNRRKKLKKLLQDERKQNLEIKRHYFKKFHFRVIFFSSKYSKTNNNINENDDSYDERNNNSYIKNIKTKLQEENKIKERKEKEQLMRKRISILQTLLFKKDRKIMIVKKNTLEKWNLKAKLISLGPKKKLIGKSIRKGDSKKKGIIKKGKKHESGKSVRINRGGNENNNEDEKEKDN